MVISHGDKLHKVNTFPNHSFKIITLERHKIIYFQEISVYEIENRLQPFNCKFYIIANERTGVDKH